MIINGYEIKPHADLKGANLEEANLRGANLEGANLRGANLGWADLRKANLKWANLRGANLRGTNLRGADLEGTNLRGADLRGANLERAFLREANLYGAFLERAKNIPQVVYDMFPIPEGELIVYKKLRDGTICKLKIPADAKRSRATSNKHRAEFAEVLEGKGRSTFNYNFFYKVGEIIKPKQPFDEDRWAECSSGIHFFLTREEAERY